MYNIKKDYNGQGPLVSVNLVVYNDEKYIRHCLDSISRQNYKNIEVNILDNNSSDSTKNIIELNIENRKLEIPNFNFFIKNENLGMWPAQEELLKYSHGKYIIVISVDILLDPNFISEVIAMMEKDEKIGAVQGRVLKFDSPVGELNTKLEIIKTKIIDTLGFEAFKSRRIVNIEHGEEDTEGFSEPKEIFAVEGAVPVFRKEALESCRLESQTGKIIDPDFFWYGDDLDIAWRMRLFGWKQVYVSTAIAWHDRKTTKQLASGSWSEFIKIRKTVPLFKRQLDWRNTIFAIIKNDLTANLLKDLPYILWRQIKLWVYFIIFETSMIFEILKVAKMLPKMLKRRREIMQKKKVSAKEMAKWFR